MPRPPTFALFGQSPAIPRSGGRSNLGERLPGFATGGVLGAGRGRPQTRELATFLQNHPSWVTPGPTRQMPAGSTVRDPCDLFTVECVKLKTRHVLGARSWPKPHLKGATRGSALYPALLPPLCSSRRTATMTPWPSVSPLSVSDRSFACSCSGVALPGPKTSSCWSCAKSSTYSTVRCPGRGFDPKSDGCSPSPSAGDQSGIVCRPS